MIRFDSDYLEGTHPAILKALADTNYIKSPGYSEDEYCTRAKEIISEKFGIEGSDIHFFTGGTITNLVVSAAALRAHHGIISPFTGHICVHETGAIEATGHKIIEVMTQNGKITANQIEDIVKSHNKDSAKEHIVKPKMVYISNPTELGTIYKREELNNIKNVCEKNDLFLYMDGARLGYALEAEGNDLDINFISQCCDAFYIGGTKVGALFGEALVIKNSAIKEDFRYIMKQRGGLFAKGRLLGIQFIELFKENLYFDMAKHANECAKIIKNACKEKGYVLYSDSYTNQQFPVIPDRESDILSEKYSFLPWQRLNEEKSVVRFCTGPFTNPDDAKTLAKDILNI